MPQLVLSSDALHDISRLPRNVVGKVTDLVTNFSQQAFAGAHLETPNNRRDDQARTVRIDNFYRGVVMAPERGDTYFLMRVLVHDDAYDWITRNVFRINAATGGIEVVDMVRVEEVVAEAAGQPAAPAMFAAFSDRTLTELGIAPDALPLVRTVTSVDQLLSLAGLLPLAQGDVLIKLSEGMTPEQVWAELTGPGPRETIDVDDFETALERDATTARFVAVEGPDELLELFSKSFAAWRVFLHPTQRRIAYRPSYSGPVRVTGGAGTGKTVVALHRAKALADSLDADQPILFTTFTKNLAAVIGANLEILGGKQLRSRITVSNVDRIAVQIVRDAEGAMPRVLMPAEQRKAWQEAVADSDCEFDADFVQREWEQVVLAQAISNRDDYLRAARPGRGGRLDRRQRMALWTAVEAFGALQLASGKRTFLQLALEAAGYAQARSVKPYAAVIVDEAQDLHPAQWRMLRALAAEGPNDMFIVGDAYQRIYGNRTTLSKVGINIVGRSYRLRVNYRTTQQILGWSVALLHGVEADDLDGQADSLSGYHSLLRGGAPTFTPCASSAAESAFLVSWVKQLVAEEFLPEQIAIAGRTTATCEAVVNALRGAGIAAALLDGDGEHADDHVAVGTMHRMKGLEFRAVAVADCSRGSVPLPAAIVPENVDPKEHARSLEIERSLLFVACTRAREVLSISWSGQPSSFVTDTGVVS